MAAKTKSTEIIKWTGLTALSAAGLGYSSIWLLKSAGMEIPAEAPQVLATGLLTIAAWKFYTRQLGRVDELIPVRQKRRAGLQDSHLSIPLTVNGKKRSLMMSAATWAFGGRSQKHQTGLAWWQFNNYVIREDLAFEWFRKGWNRQLKGDPHPFSKSWMCAQRFVSLGSRPDPQLFEALVELTWHFGLWLRIRGQGTSGKIIAGPGACLARLKGRW